MDADTPDPDPEVWQRNLASLRRTHPAVADALTAAGDDAGLDWSRGRGGQWTASASNAEGKPVLLCSRFDPHAEAAKLVGGIDHAAVPAVAVLGVGLGYHVAEVARAMAGRGRLIVYEPGVVRLRAVMTRMDLTAWLGGGNLTLFVGDAVDTDIVRRLEPHAATLTQGLRVVEHPPTRRLDAAPLRRFAAALTTTLAYCRTQVATALVNATRTYSNLTANLPHYAAGATTQPLKNLAILRSPSPREGAGGRAADTTRAAREQEGSGRDAAASNSPSPREGAGGRAVGTTRAAREQEAAALTPALSQGEREQEEAALTPALSQGERERSPIPAICVSAGPSLVKNIDLLKDPALRRGVYLIAAQTALRPLLDRGIRPDFVTALDYSPVSRRFYESLPPLPDVTLVAEAKAHPCILDLYPGPIRTTHSGYLDALLGDLARPITPIPQGATVAHLSFYLARHLGCDPIIMIGQDLGFSDGLYYCPGTAVHHEWACELNPFNTIEMMEWQRIVRMRGHLRRAEDIDGQPMFTDEQMATYLKQFERDFAKCIEAGGPTIIDATEGGIPKEGTERMTLVEAARKYVSRSAPPVPAVAEALDADRLRRLEGVLRERTRQVEALRDNARQTIPLLEDMKRHQRDPARMKRLFAKLQTRRREVETRLKDAMRLVGELNTMGGFKRAKADHAIEHAGDDPYARQAAQLDRDIENLDWLTQACDESIRLFHAAADRVQQALEDAPPGVPTSSEPPPGVPTSVGMSAESASPARHRNAA